MIKNISNNGAPRGWRLCGPREPGAVMCITAGGRKTPRRILYMRQLDPFELAVAGRFIGPGAVQPGAGDAAALRRLWRIPQRLAYRPLRRLITPPPNNRPMLYLMSTTVIPHGADGIWQMRTVGAREAAEMAAAGEWISAVGHESSAAAMSAALDLPIGANRITVGPQPGDQFLCLRLHSRPLEGVVLDREQLEQIGYSWALMEYYG